jgi:hypothetical protein
LLYLPGTWTGGFNVRSAAFVANEYTPYSTRGGQAINLKAEPEQEMVKSSGVTFEYATRWSFHPKELATLIVPRFYGALLRNPTPARPIHNCVVEKFRLLGQHAFHAIIRIYGNNYDRTRNPRIWFYRRDGFVISIFVLLIFSFLLALGSNFPVLYKRCFCTCHTSVNFASLR